MPAKATIAKQVEELFTEVDKLGEHVRELRESVDELLAKRPVASSTKNPVANKTTIK